MYSETRLRLSRRRGWPRQTSHGPAPAVQPPPSPSEPQTEARWWLRCLVHRRIVEKSADAKSRRLRRVWATSVAVFAILGGRLDAAVGLHTGASADASRRHLTPRASAASAGHGSGPRRTPGRRAAGRAGSSGGCRVPGAGHASAECPARGGPAAAGGRLLAAAFPVSRAAHDPRPDRQTRHQGPGSRRARRPRSKSPASSKVRVVAHGGSPPRQGPRARRSAHFSATSS